MLFMKRRCAVIGKKCTGRRCNNSSAQLLVRSVLMGGATTSATSRKREPK
jgi:hypothetical protein